MKKASLFVLLMLITILAAGGASFAACSATSLSAGNGTWGIEAYGVYSITTPETLLIQATFAAAGTFSGTEWQSSGGTFSGPTTISGTWSTDVPVKSCQGTIIVTSPATQTFSFALNNGAKGAALTRTDLGYTMAGFMVAEGTVTCSATMFKSKQFSLYSNGYIPAVGPVTGSGEILFASTGLTFASDPTVTLDLGGAGNVTLAATGAATIGSACTGTGSLTVTALGETFDVDFVVVDGGKEALWIVNNLESATTGYFLE